jgi:hypothetical protein
MDPGVADALRERLDKEAARNGKRHRGEELEPDGRFGRNDKRRATWAAKREAKMASMTPEERAKYERISATKRKSAEKHAAKKLKANQSAEHVAWMKEYRQANKGGRVRLGK